MLKINNPFSIHQTANGFIVVRKVHNKTIPYSSEKSTYNEAKEVADDLYYEYCMEQKYDI